MPYARTILLAEDDENEFLLMKMAFGKLGLETCFQRVRNGREVLRYLSGDAEYEDRERHPFPAILLLDLKMPVMGGFEVLQWIRNQRPFCRLIVAILTGSRNEEDIDRAYASLANSYLVKPDTLESLVKMAGHIRDYWLESNVNPYLHANSGAIPIRTSDFVTPAQVREGVI